MSFKDHFSGHASSYADARPGYPPALFHWLAAQCRGHALAWDAGCGNGQASVALADHFDRVFASDPSAAQIGNALAHPRITYAVEPAERCRLADGSADLVTVAQAYHWFDHARFCAEARRVLAPGGVVAVWTYAESRVDRAVDEVFSRLHDRLLVEDWPAGREHVISGYRDLPFPLQRIEVPTFCMSRRWDLPQYLAYLRSWSASERHLRRTGVDPVGLVAADMEAAWGDAQAVRDISWPLVVLAGRQRGPEAA